MPLFNWTAATDADGDSLNYTWNTTCWNSGGGSCDPIDGRYVENITVVNYTPTTVLKNFWDTSEYYNWTVKAWDGLEYGPETSVWKLYIDSLVSLVMINNSVNFSTMNVSNNDDTTDNVPYPLSFYNDGNCFNNLSLYSTALWVMTPSDNESYQYKFDYLETNSFSWAESIVTWTNMGIIRTVMDRLNKFNYTNATDSAEMDFNITAPGDEPPGVRNATVILTGYFTDVAE
jgi:hypothetical protein